MKGLSEILKKDKEFEKLVSALDAGASPAVMSGIAPIHRAHLAAALNSALDVPVFVICANEMEAGKMGTDLAAFSGCQVPVLTGREFTFYNAEGVSRQLEHKRIGALYQLATGQCEFGAATVDGLMQACIPKEVLLKSAINIKTGDSYDLDALCERLVGAGYTRCEQVEGVGQFARRGGILDVFSAAYDSPVRIEFWGDEVDAMGLFDVATQRRSENIFEAEILPGAETLPEFYPGGGEALAAKLRADIAALAGKKTTNRELLKNMEADAVRLENHLTLYNGDKYISIIYGGKRSAIEYIPQNALILLSEPAKLKERTKNYVWQLTEDVDALKSSGVVQSVPEDYFTPWSDVCDRLKDFPVIMADSFLGSDYPMTPKQLLNMQTKQLPSYGGSFDTAAGDIGHYLRSGFGVAVLCLSEEKARRLEENLRGLGFPVYLDFELENTPQSGKCAVGVGALSAGFEYPGIKLAVITEGQMVEAARPKKKKQVANRQKINSYTDLNPGDLVVHEHHGIGRFAGICRIPVDGVEKDYIKIMYQGTDSLYVPATQLDMVSKYIGGGEDGNVRLSKMGGSDWQRAKSRAKGAVKELAKELIALYAKRKRMKGYAFSPDSDWQREFEDKFPYSETDDQLKSIQEIKSDMEKDTPMDRLLCGDVGYGKTEVALRGVMKCVLDGKQAAILVPTTVLAQQHYATVINRFAGYPVRVEVLSRFRTAGQIKKSVEAIRDGSADIVIGTHRLLQKDIKFKDLGLLIVDEEQRFGVTHKERLKELGSQVDTLTLSATPIPRTLNMALSGLRDMSTIEEPPSDRHPVQTYVLEHDWSIIGDAIRRELARGGQVYYLHNRVETINGTAARLSKMFDGVNVGVAHGQMTEEELSNAMESVISGDVQILVCTTIIETGIDIPNVNTLIIEDADKMGLAQLHQIRGRVGRSSRRAFAYLTFRRGKVLTEVAQKRLSAIREFAEFGSGFKIAMRDLEIRGAGNLLGAEQSGHMMSVGYDMYLKLLEEAVLEEKGEKVPAKTECSADLAVAANIPEWYIPSGEQRMDLYRRIAYIRNEEDADDLIDELADRFGDIPKSVHDLIRVALLRGQAALAGISDIAQKSGYLKFKLTDFNMDTVSALYARPEYRGRIKIEAGNVPQINLKIRVPKKVLDEASSFIKDFAQADSAVKEKKQ